MPSRVFDICSVLVRTEILVFFFQFSFNSGVDLLMFLELVYYVNFVCFGVSKFLSL